MKFKTSILFLAMLAMLVSACGILGKKSNSTAVCVSEKVALKADASEKGKWLANVNLGEKVTYLDESVTDESGKKPVEYLKVALKEGKEGWVRADHIVLNSQPAVVIYNATIYNRPDLLTKSNKGFAAMDIVAVKTGEDANWLEVVGKRTDGKGIETGWLKPENVSYLDVDIAVAIFIKAALAENDDDKRLSMLQEITSNSDLSNSFFMQNVYDMINYLAGDEEVYAEDAYEGEDEGSAEVPREDAEANDSVYVVE